MSFRFEFSVELLRLGRGWVQSGDLTRYMGASVALREGVRFGAILCFGFEGWR